MKCKRYLHPSQGGIYCPICFCPIALANLVEPIEVWFERANGLTSIHFEQEHPRRLRLFNLTGWRWLVKGML